MRLGTLEVCRNIPRQDASTSTMYESRAYNASGHAMQDIRPKERIMQTLCTDPRGYGYGSPVELRLKRLTAGNGLKRPVEHFANSKVF